MAKLEPYSKKGDISYALGVYPALKLIEHRPECALRLLLHPDGERNSGVDLLRERCAEAGVREEFAERVLRRESRKDNCHAAIAFRKYECSLDGGTSHVALWRVGDAGNLGSIIRTCLGFGIRDIAVIRPCVDEFDPHVLRASMGACFSANVRPYDSFDQYMAAHPGREIYPFMLDSSLPLGEVAPGAVSPFTLVFGNEQTGLPPEFAGYGRPVRIPQSGEIDSLNLAAAVAVGAYAFTAGKCEIKVG